MTDKVHKTDTLSSKIFIGNVFLSPCRLPQGLIMAKRIMRGKGINTGDLTGMSIVSHGEEKKTSC